MSAPDAARWTFLPPRLRPRERDEEGAGTMRLVETTLLVLAAVLLLSATVNDLVRQTKINHRLQADARTWRAYSGHDFHGLAIDEEFFGASTHKEVVCGNTSPGAPKSRIQLCLIVTGPVRAGRRTVTGGWYIPPGSEDAARERYACFGAGAEGRCPR